MNVVWTTFTDHHNGAHLTIQNDGELAIYSADGNVKLWSAHTGFSKSKLLDSFTCNRQLGDYENALRYSVSARGESTRPGLGNGEKLAAVLKLVENHKALRVFNVLRHLEAWDVLAFR